MLTKEELHQIKGGGISAALLNSLSRIISTLYNLGQSVGSSIRRARDKNYCKIL